MQLQPLRRGSRRRPRGHSIDLLYARDGTPGKQIVVQWVVALLLARDVGGSVFLRCGNPAADFPWATSADSTASSLDGTHSGVPYQAWFYKNCCVMFHEIVHGRQVRKRKHPTRRMLPSNITYCVGIAQRTPYPTPKATV